MTKEAEKHKKKIDMEKGFKVKTKEELREAITDIVYTKLQLGYRIDLIMRTFDNYLEYLEKTNE